MPDRFLVDGERPLGPGSPLVALHTPGHTPGHVCFYDSDRNVVLTGDHILPRITPNISPAPGETDDIARRSTWRRCRRMKGLAVEEVLPAHEYRFIGLDARIDGLRTHHQARLGEVMALLREVPGRTSVQVAERLRVEPSLGPDAGHAAPVRGRRGLLAPRSPGSTRDTW